MPLKVQCFSCGAGFTAPDSAAGRQATCSKCGAVLVIPSAAVAETSAAAPVASGALPPVQVPHAPIATVAWPLYPVPQPPPVAPYPANVELADRHTECPFCGEEILAKAKKCKHCLETLDVTRRAAEESERESRRGRRRGRRQTINIRQETYIDARSPAFNHGLHLILDLVTCGGWLPIHFLCWILH